MFTECSEVFMKCMNYAVYERRMVFRDDRERDLAAPSCNMLGVVTETEGPDVPSSPVLTLAGLTDQSYSFFNL